MEMEPKFDIIFQEEGHRYFITEAPVPSVTQVLAGVGITDYSKVPLEQLVACQVFGKAVHKTTEFYDRKILNLSTLDPRLLPYLEAWIKFRTDYGFIPEGIERLVGSAKYMFAGQLDRDGIMRGRPRKVIVDIKTSFELDIPATALQTAGYEIGLQERYGIRSGYDRAVILLQPRGDYKIEWCTDKHDRAVFLSALTTLNYKRRHNRCQKLS